MKNIGAVIRINTIPEDITSESVLFFISKSILRNERFISSSYIKEYRCRNSKNKTKAISENNN